MKKLESLDRKDDSKLLDSSNQKRRPNKESENSVVSLKLLSRLNEQIAMSNPGEKIRIGPSPIRGSDINNNRPAISYRKPTNPKGIKHVNSKMLKTFLNPLSDTKDDNNN